MKKIVTEFKDFISRGNVMDMAVGVIVGGAFGKITSSLVNDVFMPFLGWVIGDIDLTALNITLSPAVMEGETVIKEPVVVGIGSFLATIIDFLLIALDVGYAKPGTECVYNIDMMEDTTAIMSHGAGAMTKCVYDAARRVERVPAPKEISTYIAKVEKLSGEKARLFL